jgi:hypothetical protein
MVKKLSFVYYNHIAPSVRNIICMTQLYGGTVDLSPYFVTFSRDLSGPDSIRAGILLNHLVQKAQVDNCKDDSTACTIVVENPNVEKGYSKLKLTSKALLPLLMMELGI